VIATVEKKAPEINGESLSVAAMKKIRVKS